jgi:galactose-1-phosphate uridylyltransferase
MKYIQIKSDSVPIFIGTAEHVIEHLKEYYFSDWALKDFKNSTEKLTITPITMTEKRFEEQVGVILREEKGKIIVTKYDITK